jgi:hypothetical protein
MEYPPACSENLGFGYRTEKYKKYKFRTIRAKPSIVGATTDICVASDFTTRQ